MLAAANTARRRRRTWGAIDVDGAAGGAFYWRDGRRARIDQFPSVEDAAAFVDQKLREKLTYADGGYRRLPPPNKIW